MKKLKKIEKKKKGFSIGLETLAMILIIAGSLALIIFIILILSGKLGGTLSYIKDIFRFSK